MSRLEILEVTRSQARIDWSLECVRLEVHNVFTKELRDNHKILVRALEDPGTESGVTGSAPVISNPEREREGERFLGEERSQNSRSGARREQMFLEKPHVHPA